ncbi:dynamin family protein [Calothrix rhizosoleniae]|uniref:dynamin family protein n=1 Tax=Calothrix rhizosoleniae TaxID=888997 RepID=UPI000B498CCB|nr:dynamin family protein [Calothrix rhizosoleniae]
MQQVLQNYQQLATAIKSASKLLDLDPKSALYTDAIAICHHLTNPNLRIAVFAPFNHGKSTLINAMLGNKTLPIDLIPTTGAAIIVKYGTDLRTRIVLVDGTEIYRPGTDILKKFAVLDGERRMRGDVASVEVFCPHPLLETGVEFLDLPGTNDREAQDNLVRQQLLGADLVVQLLDARKLMTLEERENLRDWLWERGIKTVIFVANFLNLLEPDEQKQVQHRLRFVAESFRAELPSGFSNLYRVDALPALRARLKGDVAAANTSGLIEFETALQNLVRILQKDTQVVRKPRVEKIAAKIQRSLKIKITPLEVEIAQFSDKNQAKYNIKKRAAELIKQGFHQSINELKDFLNITNLRDKYQADAAVALAQNEFKSWEIDHLKQDLKQLQLEVSKWLYQANEIFQTTRPEDLFINLPNTPQVTLPHKPGIDDGISDPSSLAVGGGIVWLLGGPVGAAVVGSITYMVNKNLQKTETKTSNESYHQQVAKICLDAVDDYLMQVNRQGLSIIDKYQQQLEIIIQFNRSELPLEIQQKQIELQKWQNSLSELNQQLQKSLDIPITDEFKIEAKTFNSPEIKPPQTQTKSSVYSFSGKGVKEEVVIPRKAPQQQQNQQTNQTTTKKSPPSSPPPPAHDLEAKFSAWEIDQEIAQMKANMGKSGFNRSKKNNNQQNQTNKDNKSNNKSQAKVDQQQINRAYKILGLQPGVSIVEIKNTYKKLVRKWHPDLYIDKPEMKQKAEKNMRLVNEAYSLLSQQ